jgi:hypothetical protein
MRIKKYPKMRSKTPLIYLVLRYCGQKKQMQISLALFKYLFNWKKVNYSIQWQLIL